MSTLQDARGSPGYALLTGLCQQAEEYHQAYERHGNLADLSRAGQQAHRELERLQRRGPVRAPGAGYLAERPPPAGGGPRARRGGGVKCHFPVAGDGTGVPGGVPRRPAGTSRGRARWSARAGRWTPPPWPAMLTAPRRITREDRERQLAELSGLARDAAACAIQLGQPQLAVALLEHGRGVLLGQALDTRTELAWERLLATIRGLPGLGRSSSPRTSPACCPPPPAAGRLSS